MATTRKLSFGLDKAGGAALILARIGAALLWIIAALAAVVWVVFLISPRSFAANFGSVDLNVGGAFTPQQSRATCWTTPIICRTSTTVPSTW